MSVSNAKGITSPYISFYKVDPYSAAIKLDTRFDLMKGDRFAITYGINDALSEDNRVAQLTETLDLFGMNIEISLRTPIK